MKIKLSSDNYFITSRIREIDSSYYIVYDTESAKFELHSTAQGKDSLCLVIPYDELDARVIELAHRTRICNLDKLSASMDRENERLGRGSYFAG